jgi:hypothetical protein
MYRIATMATTTSSKADPAFAGVTPEARDLAGAATGARQERDLSEAMHAGVDRVLH